MSEHKLTVWCVCTFDKYHSGYVYALKEMVEKYLTVPHTFKCITDRNLPGIHTVKPPLPYRSWWSKLGLFYPGIATGPSLYFDLDVVIVGNIDYLVDYTDCQFAAPANWAQSGHGGIQSSVMAWSGNWHEPVEKLNWPDDGRTYWGDQEYLWDLLKDDWVRVPGVCSYKYHIRGRKLIEKIPVICFHGKPDPHEVNDPCLLPFTATLRKLINESTPIGLETDLKSTA